LWPWKWFAAFAAIILAGFAVGWEMDPEPAGTAPIANPLPNSEVGRVVPDEPPGRPMTLRHRDADATADMPRLGGDASPYLGDSTAGLRVSSMGTDIRQARDDSPYPGISGAREQTPMAQYASNNRTTLSDSFNSADLDRIIDEMNALLDTFGAGDSRARVIALQGQPDEARESILRYGSSLVYFDSKGRVRGWTDGWPRLRVLEWPTLFQDPLDSFGPGSSRSDVVRAMGLPTAYTRAIYNYGSSEIRFKDGRVFSWTEGDTPLNATDFPSEPFVDLDSR
jgi:hypothetical protein